MSIKNYKDKKSKGLAEVVVAGGSYALAVRRFSEDDGSELETEIESINLDAIKSSKAELEMEVTDYATLINDVEKMK